ncbi:hypothetical protein ACP4OV_007789 [Aristida adscensionis]
MAKLPAVRFILAYLLSTAVAAGGVLTQAGDAAFMHHLAAALGADVAVLWIPTLDPCDEPWFGVACNGAGRVTSITVRGLRLNGSLPSDMCVLAWLETLDVSHNLISGALPGIWPTRLNTLRLDNNLFTEVPIQCFVDLRELLFFSASNNWLLRPWELPHRQLRRITNLSTFDVNNAGLVGGVAHFLGDEGDGAFPLLGRVSLARNKLSGSLPEKFGTQKLDELDLSHNGLSGPITSVAGLVNMRMLHMNSNN